MGSRDNSIAVIVRRLVRVARAFLPAAAVDDEYLRFPNILGDQGGDFGLETILVYTDLQLTLNCDKAQILNIFAMILGECGHGHGRVHST